MKINHDFGQFVVNDSRSRPELVKTLNGASTFAVLTGYACVMDDAVERIAVYVKELNKKFSPHRVRAFLPYYRGNLLGSCYPVDLNKPRCFFKYALVQEYVSAGPWDAHLRILRFCISAY